MKKSIHLIVFIIALTFNFNAFSQAVCGGIFMDSGGATGQYQNNENISTTIAPSIAGQVVSVDFFAFDTEDNFDVLKIYNGNGISSTLIGTYSGTTSPGLITSTDPTGSLTFVFTSDATVSAAGWQAAISCANPVIVTCPTPTVLIATATTSNNTILSWTENGTAAQWNVTVSGGGTTFTTTATSNPYTVSGLSESTVYTITVQAVCSPTDSSLISNALTVTTPACAIAPTSLFAQNITSNSANISWAGGTTSANYEISITPSTSTTPIIATTAPYVATGLLPATVYQCSIRTICSAGGFSAWSNSFSFTTLPLIVPPPTPVCGGQFIDNGGLTANYNNSSNQTVTIYPTNPGEVVTVTFTTFDVEARYDGLFVYNGNSITAPQISSGNTANGTVLGAGAFYGTIAPGPFTSTAADGSLTFKFTSDASVNKVGWVANVTCGLPLTCPRPISIVASNLTINSASINWTETGSATQWEVLVLPAGTTPTAAATGVITTTRPYLLSGLTPATTYNVFIRSICSTTDFSAWSPMTITTAGCLTPTVFAPTSTTTTTGSTWSWQGVAGSQYEVLVLPATATAPTATSVGTSVTTFTYPTTGLTCGTAYKCYVRLICSTTLSSAWSVGTTYTMPACTLSTAVPQNMNSCSDTGLNCFDLTTNGTLILAGVVTPGSYTVSYFSNAAMTTPIVNPAAYCLTNTTATIYVKLVKAVTLETQTLTFTVSSKSIISTTTVLPIMTGCDDNFDGLVVFNLTSAPITTTNVLEYYTSLANATAQTNPILAPNAYAISILLTTTNTIFVREIIVGNCDNMFSFQLGAYADCNLAYNCSAANSLCGSLGVPFANTHQSLQAEPGNAYGCLSSKPNPTWFYVHISNPGNINLKIEQNADITFASTTGGQDVDYVVYGPFTNPTAQCGALTASQIVSCSFSGAAVEYPIIPNTIAGQYYLIMTTNFSNRAGFIKITALPTSTGAIDCSGIRMNAFIDSDGNGSQGTGEVNFPLGQFHYTVNAGVMHNIVSPTGVYGIYDTNATNVYNLGYTIDPAYAADYSIATSSYSGVSVVASGGTTTYNFPISVVNAYNDLAVTVLPINAPRAGASYKNVIAYANLGNQMLATGMVTFNKDAATTISTISQTGTVPTATGFTYNFTNLLPFEVRYITVTMLIPPIPTVALAQLLTNTASIIPPTGDVVASNNNSISVQSIIAAYDPNDKTEAHGEKILFSGFAANEYLTYTIRFENLGNASAIDVRINDVLDSRIDETSIKMVAASHAYTLDRVGNILNWNFDNIQLPVSVADTNIGKGYVTFQAKLRPGFAVGSIIPNEASIYFDTNPAVVTNTFRTEFTAALANQSFDISNFGLYPNPANDMVYINLQNTNENIDSIAINDLLGKSVKKLENIGSKNTSFNVSDLAKGIYLVIINTETNLKQTKKLVVE